MIVISTNIVLAAVGSIDGDSPVILWDNLVTVDTLSADTEAAGYPATNLANPNTHEIWKADDTSDQYITIATGVEQEIEALGVARHNFGSGAIVVSVEAFIGGVWTEVVQEFQPSDDAPLIFRFTRGIYSQVRLKLQPGLVAPQAAVVYAGPLLVMERKLYQGHTPLKYARMENVTNGYSEAGNFLGRITTGRWRESSAKFSLLDPDWVRLNLEPFLEARPPFFFAWRPESYPLEAGYAVLTAPPRWAPAAQHSLVEIDLPMKGVA